MTITAPPIVLASTSPFRRELLSRLGIAFDVQSPEIDETAQAGESPQQLVKRLASAKAKAVADTLSQGLVIGSDQVAVIDDTILGKPGDHATAVQQLQAAAGRAVTFYTGLCLVNAASGEQQVDVVPFEVTFRQLTEAQIENYLQQEQPYNCAGSFKSEGLGIALFQKMQGEDPNALVGLPLIRLIDMLREEGVDVLG